MRHLLQHLALHARLHQPLGFSQRRWRLDRELAGDRPGHAVGFHRRHHTVDQTHLERRFGHERLSQQQSFSRAVVAQHLRHQQAGCRFRAQTEVHERHRKGSVVTGIDEIAVEQHGGPDAHCRTADSRHQRLWETGNAAQEAEHRRVLARRRLVQEVADVVAGGEHRLMPLQHGDANRRVFFGLRDGIGQHGVHGRRDRVLALQPVQRDGHHAVFNVGEDMVHGISLVNSSRYWPRNMWPVHSL